MKTDKKIKKYNQIAKIAQKLHKSDRKIVLTSGCYDLLHLGHVVHLNNAHQKGNVLIVNVGSDETVKILKGPGRPIFPELVRARSLAALEIVDYVVISEETGKMDHKVLIDLVKPEIYIINQTDSHLEEKRLLVESVGGKLVALKRVPPKHSKGISTSSMAHKIEHL